MPDSSSVGCWHVVKAAPGKTLRLADDLARSYPTVCPRLSVNFAGRGGRVSSREVAAFAPYVFVAAPLAEDAVVWHRVNGLRDVSEIMGGEHPWSVGQREMERLLARVDDEGMVIDRELLRMTAAYRRGYDAGDAVRFLRGSWAGNAGLCLAVKGFRVDDAIFEGLTMREISDDDVVAVKISLLRRPVLVYAQSSQCVLAR